MLRTVRLDLPLNGRHKTTVRLNISTAQKPSSSLLVEYEVDQICHTSKYAVHLLLSLHL